MALRSRIHELFVESRSSADSRSIMGMMREEGNPHGAFALSALDLESADLLIAGLHNRVVTRDSGYRCTARFSRCTQNWRVSDKERERV